MNKLYPGYQTTKYDKCREKAKGDLIILPPHVATTSPVGKTKSIESLFGQMSVHLQKHPLGVSMSSITFFVGGCRWCNRRPREQQPAVRGFTGGGRPLIIGFYRNPRSLPLSYLVKFSWSIIFLGKEDHGES